MSELSHFLKSVPIFADLNEDELRQVADIAISRTMAKKGVIFTEGTEKEAVFFVQDGLIKTFKTDENGHEQIVSFLKTGEMFPHTGLFNQNPYPATAEAIVDTKLVAIPVFALETLMLNYPSIAIKMLRMLGEKIMELQEKIQVLTGQDVKHRLITLLLHLAEKHGIQSGKKITINLPITNQEIANSVGTTRETVNRLLNQLDKDGIVKAARHSIVILDLDELKTN